MVIDFSIFGGVAPRFGDRKLAPPYAVTADNCKMDRGQLRGFGGNESAYGSVTLINDIKSFHIYEPESTKYVLQFNERASVVDDANVSDVYKRVYWTTETGAPQMGAKDDIIFGAGPFPYDSYDLGIPVPLGLVSLLRNTTGESPPQEDIDDEVATPYIRSYTYTYVSSYGEESPPYVPVDGSALPQITLYEGDTVTISGFATGPAGDHAMTGAAKKRVYQTDVAGNFRLVAEIPLAQTVLTIDHMAFDSAPIINQQILVGAPPVSNLEGLVLSPFGYLVAFEGNTVHASSRYLYHNWPAINRKTAASKVMGCVPVRKGVLVITDSGLYLLTGADPSNTTMVKIDETLGCVSKESIVDMGEYVLYASTNGIVFGSVSEAKIITLDYILENDWVDYGPSTMKAYRHLHRYIIGNATHKFIVNHKSEYDRLVTHDLDIKAGFTSEEDGYLYYVPEGQTSIFKFDSDSANPRAYEWKSTTIINKMPTVVSCFKVDADDFTDITMQVYMDKMPLFSGDGLVLDVNEVDSRNEHIMYGRLPKFPSSLDVVLELKGTSPINGVYLSDSFEELKS